MTFLIQLKKKKLLTMRTIESIVKYEFGHWQEAL